ncbi:MAG: hypothetical protein JOZ13_17450 [Alphaproteobacteria bacterium]|nr:hypothetical protein [Alphaproteobacteria bacterium]
MPILSRRRLQSMLDEFGPWLTKPQAAHLVSRLDHRNPDSSIPAEYELLVGWAVSQVADLKAEPRYGRRKPDFESSDLFPDRPAVIEVVTLSDEGLSDESLMQRTANIINQFAARVRRNASRNLHCTFHDRSGYRRVPLREPLGPFTHRSQYWRQRLASNNFELTHQHEAKLRAWLAKWPPSSPFT